MPGTLSNLLRDTLGINRAVGYRLLVERRWRSRQPMLNIMQVKEGTVPLFKEFLAGALKLSLRYDTPLSFGPYLHEESRTFFYITGYASTPAFMKVSLGLLTHGLAKMRARATQKTSWTYCHYTAPHTNVQDMVLVGVQGSPQPFTNFINQQGLQPFLRLYRKKSVRGHVLSHYWAFARQEALLQKLAQFREAGGTFVLYQGSRYTDTPSA